MTNHDYKKLGQKIKSVRTKRGYTQAQLSEQIECSTSYISYVEQGHKSLSLEMFVLVANALNVSADELLRDCLENTIVVSNHDFASLLADCTSYESRVLLDVIRATKQSLRENHRMIVGRRK